MIRWQLPLVGLASLAAWWLLPAAWAGLRAPLAWVMAFFVVTFSTRALHATLQGLQDLVFLGQVQVASWSAGTAIMVGTGPQRPASRGARDGVARHAERDHRGVLVEDPVAIPRRVGADDLVGVVGGRGGSTSPSRCG